MNDGTLIKQSSQQLLKDMREMKRSLWPKNDQEGEKGRSISKKRPKKPDDEWPGHEVSVTVWLRSKWEVTGTLNAKDLPSGTWGKDRTPAFLCIKDATVMIHDPVKPPAPHRVTHRLFEPHEKEAPKPTSVWVPVEEIVLIVQNPLAGQPNGASPVSAPLAGTLTGG
jgi:hypothetical protein